MSSPSMTSPHPTPSLVCFFGHFSPEFRAKMTQIFDFLAQCRRSWVQVTGPEKYQNVFFLYEIRRGVNLTLINTKRHPRKFKSSFGQSFCRKFSFVFFVFLLKKLFIQPVVYLASADKFFNELKRHQKLNKTAISSNQKNLSGAMKRLLDQLIKQRGAALRVIHLKGVALFCGVNDSLTDFSFRKLRAFRESRSDEF